MARENQMPVEGRFKRTPTFELRRFVWGTPDRLLVSGSFEGRRDRPDDAPAVLVVKAGETMHRLPAVPETVDGPPENGRVWQAQFAWQDPPVAFGAAELQLGHLVVELPEASARRRRERPRLLPVRGEELGGSEPRRDTMQIGDDAPAPTAVPPEEAADVGGASVGSQVDLLAAQEEVREVRTALQQIQAELGRARDDLEAERERRTADSERYRSGLANVRGLAEQAVSAEQAVVSRLGTELREAEAALETNAAQMDTLRAQLEGAEARRTEAEAALETNAAQMDTLRAQLEGADAARTEAEARAQTEGETLRREVAELRSRGEEAEHLRSELEKAHGAVENARSDAERLLGRLNSIRHGWEG
jgi:DNA repair exonuclease SbcCD ATPase subunit